MVPYRLTLERKRANVSANERRLEWYTTGKTLKRPIRHRQKVNALYTVGSSIYKADSSNMYYKKRDVT